MILHLKSIACFWIIFKVSDGESPYVLIRVMIGCVAHSEEQKGKLVIASEDFMQHGDAGGAARVYKSRNGRP